jgi:type I restriction enzyme S subunit
MTNLRPYPSYKESGIHWIGQVPEHWEVQRAKRLLLETNDRAGTDDLELLSLSKTRGVVPHRLLSERLASASEFSQYRRVKPGQLVMNRMQAWNGLFGSSPLTGMISPDYAVFNVNSKSAVLGFLLRLVRDPLWIQQFAALSTRVGSGFNRLYSEDLGTVPFLVPPIPEQQTIADFLDVADARISRYIAAKRRMIALLEEQKQAIINQAVTRGLDPDVLLKPSGVEWLGDIPAHWEAKRSRFAFREIDEWAQNDNLPRLSMSQKRGLVPVDQIESWRMQSESAVGAKVCSKNDLVLNRLKAHLAVFAHAPIRGTVSPDYTVLRPQVGVDVQFFEYLYRTRTYRNQFFIRTKGIVEGFWRLYTDAFYAVPVLLPPLNEQRSIVQELARVTDSTSAANHQAEREIKLVQEYRTRLISDVVTGKLDVRGVELPPLEGFNDVTLEDTQLGDQDDDSLASEDPS